MSETDIHGEGEEWKGVDPGRVRLPGHSASRLTGELLEFLNSRGISTAVFAIRDPDSDAFVTHERGDMLWCIGAMESLRNEAKGVSIAEGYLKARAAAARGEGGNKNGG